MVKEVGFLNLYSNIVPKGTIFAYRKIWKRFYKVNSNNGVIFGSFLKY